MAIYATNESNGNNFNPIENGTHVATCVQMIHIGTVEDEFDGKPVKGNKVRITFELPNELVKFKDDEPQQPRFISKEFTLSMNEKASLRKFLNSWRGVPFTEEEAVKFDICKLLGLPVMLSITTKTSKTGKQYNDILSASALMKGMNAPEILTEVLEINYQNLKDNYSKVPKFLREKMALTPEYLSSGFVFPADEDKPTDQSATEPETETAQTETIENVDKKVKLPF
ncbi:hypothetical protein UFOVP105_46 [uncultured Caudovirales phage]|uniref:Uncharacterized protein n=1 Tax=uncultured Caudovirales phage TaxID=2100421 RepID=A0A6J5L2C6_9CAUD|nr:hypothetical protein UFOVP105_46 [uncultured Caudovirales phage]